MHLSQLFVNCFAKDTEKKARKHKTGRAIEGARGRAGDSEGGREGVAPAAGQVGRERKLRPNCEFSTYDSGRSIDLE